MDENLGELIKRSRILLQNPYAYLDGDGGFEAELTPTKPRNVHEARKLLGNQWAYVDEEGGFSGWHPDQPQLLIDQKSILGGRKQGKRFSKRDIEAIATKALTELWRHRERLWPGQTLTPLEVINPRVALTCLGYEVESDDVLGQYDGEDGLFEVAGLLDRDNQRAHVSPRFSPEIQNFTLAHELGHVVLHDGSGLHRDRALDGSQNGLPSDPVETEANNFAAYFLMPARPVRRAFQERFLTDQFHLSDDTAFALMSEALEMVEGKFRSTRDLARYLSAAEYYNGVRFVSLAKEFQVSIEAMAIRLEELGLLQLR